MQIVVQVSVLVGHNIIFGLLKFYSLCNWPGTIILDTVCLSESAGRTTPKDEVIIAKLQALQPSLDRQKIFDELLTIKHNDIASTVKLLLCF